MMGDKHARVEVLNPAQTALAAAPSALPWSSCSFPSSGFCLCLKLLRILEPTCILSAYSVNEPF